MLSSEGFELIGCHASRLGRERVGGKGFDGRLVKNPTIRENSIVSRTILPEWVYVPT